MTNEYTIERDVLVTPQGDMFLLDGNHSVLKYITGELKVPDVSIYNFKNNLNYRSRLCAKKKITYRHIVFPDKQSVQSDSFPIDSIIRLAEHYISRDPDLAGKFIYPLEPLRRDPKGAFLPLDTHMTDLGTATAMKALLQDIGYDDTDAINSVFQAVSLKKTYLGDLSRRLEPPLEGKAVTLAPTWRFSRFTSTEKMNDGLTDLLFSPDATYDETLLLFGDSFFRNMLGHLSRVFTRIVCLRTRYIHPEMIDLIQPNIIISGNVERYLSFVESDSQRAPYFFYNYVNPETISGDTNFTEAYRAFLTRGSDFSQAFFTQLMDNV